MLLAEELLRKRGGFIPVAERDVVKAIDALGEPGPVVARRAARAALHQVVFGGVTEQAPFSPDTSSSVVWTHGADTITALEELSAEGGLPSTVMLTGDGGFAVSPAALSRLPHELRRHLTRDYQADLERSQAIEVFTRLCMSTGGIFVLDPEIQDVLLCAFGGVQAEGLPPLPYPRIWIEAANESPLVDLTEWMPPDTSTPEAAQVWGIGISEITRGSAWGVSAVRHRDWSFGPNQDWSSPFYQRVSAGVFPLIPDSPAACFAPAGAKDGELWWEQTEAAMAAALGGYALLIADVITARTTRRDPFVLPRPRRRALTRLIPGGSSSPGPVMYHVRIQTDEARDAEETGRSLSCRFLVRGHWRESSADHAEWVAAKQARCVWVSAYVKGPPGAPWKGRPVYIERSETR